MGRGAANGRSPETHEGKLKKTKNAPDKSFPMTKTVTCYRMICRALSRYQLFQGPADYQYYFLLLKKYKMKFGIQIYGFCLMPDSVHLIAQAESKKNLQNFIRMANHSYLSYFSEKYKRDGQLWRERIQSSVIDNIEEVFGCIKHVELNPVRARLTHTPLEYRWSSCIYRVLNESNTYVHIFRGHVPTRRFRAKRYVSSEDKFCRECS